MEKIIVDSSKVMGKIRPLHGVCNVPWESVTEELERNYIKDYEEAGVPICRYHDQGGRYGGGAYVDIPNIFRNFDADENDPANYDFTFTDFLVKRCIEHGVQVLYRLGITIENDNFLKHYHTDPPKDYNKWARICEHIIAHYNEGWADGFKYNIIYWEIWNEPEVRCAYARSGDEQMWNGTDEQYWELYKVTATHLKERFPYIKVGGYSSIGLYEVVRASISPSQNVDHSPNKLFNCFHGFLKYLTKDGKKVPLDFFSWHSYHTKPTDNSIMSVYIKTQLKLYGYPECENINDEWNPNITLRGKLQDCANVAANILSYQKNMLDMATYYAISRLNSNYNGWYHPYTGERLKTYYVFKGFNQLYRLENELESYCSNENIYVGAAKKDNKLCLMIANYDGGDTKVDIEIKNFGATKAKMNCIDKDSWYDEVILDGKDNLTIELPKHAVYVLTFEK